jgi:isopenicillin-N epimerase
MIGSLVAVPVPADFPLAPRLDEPDALQTVLFDRFGLELLVFTWRALETRILRVSAQIYNTAADYERLAQALGALRDGSRRTEGETARP